MEKRRSFERNKTLSQGKIPRHGMVLPKKILNQEESNINKTSNIEKILNQEESNINKTSNTEKILKRKKTLSQGKTQMRPKKNSLDQGNQKISNREKSFRREKSLINEPYEKSLMIEPHDKLLINKPHSKSLINKRHSKSLINKPCEKTLINKPCENTDFPKPNNSSVSAKKRRKTFGHEKIITNKSLGKNQKSPPYVETLSSPNDFQFREKPSFSSEKPSFSSEKSHFSEGKLEKSHFSEGKLEKSHFSEGKLEKSHFSEGKLEKLRNRKKSRSTDISKKNARASLIIPTYIIEDNVEAHSCLKKSRSSADISKQLVKPSKLSTETSKPSIKFSRSSSTVSVDFLLAKRRSTDILKPRIESAQKYLVICYDRKIWNPIAIFIPENKIKGPIEDKITKLFNLISLIKSPLIRLDLDTNNISKKLMLECWKYEESVKFLEDIPAELNYWKELLDDFKPQCSSSFQAEYIKNKSGKYNDIYKNSNMTRDSTNEEYVEWYTHSLSGLVNSKSENLLEELPKIKEFQNVPLIVERFVIISNNELIQKT
jgi:hypothetical protein